MFSMKPYEKWDILQASTGAFTGFLNHQSYLPSWHFWYRRLFKAKSRLLKSLILAEKSPDEMSKKKKQGSCK